MAYAPRSHVTSTDPEMLANLAGRLSKHTRFISAECEMDDDPFNTVAESTLVDDRGGKRDPRDPSSAVQGLAEPLVCEVNGAALPIQETPPTAIVHASHQPKYKGQSQAPVPNHLGCHNRKNTLRRSRTTTTAAGHTSSASLSLLATPKRFRSFQQSHQTLPEASSGSNTDHRSYDISSRPLPRREDSTPFVIKARSLAASKRLAKLCLDTQPVYKHKALLYSSISTAHLRRGATCVPILSKHLRGRRRARADSYSSSSSESTSLGEPLDMESKMPKHMYSMYDSMHTGVARLTEDFANSLQLEKPVSGFDCGHMSSPSVASTCSDRSLFSEESYLSSHTKNSPHLTSDSVHCVNRTSAGHPSGQHILSLHHHSAEVASNRITAQPRSSTYKQSTQSRYNTYLQLDDNRSRYFSRRNAIAPIADIERPKRTGASTFGPIRTSRSVKSARTPFAVSYLDVPTRARPHSPPPKPTSNKMDLGYLLQPSRRSSMPALYLSAQLGSPMRLASPRPVLADRRKESTRDCGKMDIDNEDDLDFCCKGYESPAILPQIRISRSEHFPTPHERDTSVTPVSQLSRRRGKVVQSLELR